MPKVPPKAVLEVSDVRRAMEVAAAEGTRTHALFAWLYEFGARASEPGLQRLGDLDIRSGRARPRHLKDGAQQEWHALLTFCREALPKWLNEHKSHVQAPEQASYLFPGEPGRCLVCHGTGKRIVLMRDGLRRFAGEKIACHHCDSTGKRWGVSRIEIHALVTDVLTRAKAPYTHPHVLRHSIITHLLEGGIPPATVQARVGHRSLATTLAYAHGTKAAAAGIEKALAGLGLYGEKT